MKDIKLLIFDFDGTLCDTQETIIRTIQMTMKELGLPVASREECISSIGLSLPLAFAKFYPDMPEGEWQHCADTYRRIFYANKDALRPKLFPGVKQTLMELKSRGYVLTIATSRSDKSLQDFIDDLDLAEPFSYLLGATSTVKSKPDPEPVLKTLKDLGFGPAEALVIGDMPYDILMGKRAGAFASGVTYGNGTREELIENGADFTIDRIEELLERLPQA